MLVVRRKLIDVVCILLAVASLLAALLARDRDTKLLFLFGQMSLPFLWAAWAVPERNRRKIRVAAWIMALLSGWLANNSIHTASNRVILISVVVLMLAFSEWCLTRPKGSS